MRRYFLLFLLCLAACTPVTPAKHDPVDPVTQTKVILTPGAPVTAIAHGTIITGQDQLPIENGLLLLQGDRIQFVGRLGEVEIPPKSKVIDASGMTVLPGFINAHIHRGYSKEMLQRWVQGGVTTVRDEGTSPGNLLKTGLALRDKLKADPQVARLVSAGAMMGVSGGYGNLFVGSVDEAIAATRHELEQGVDQVKVSLEDGYAGKHGLPKLTPEELRAIVETAHASGVRVSGHITQAAYIPMMLDAGVDDIAHLAWDPIPPETIQRMVDEGVYLIPTFTVFRNYGATADPLVANLKSFVEAGGMVAMGNDFGGGPGEFEIGIPLYEVEMMEKAGMSPLEIIQAGTKNAAVVMGLQDKVGTLEAGKVADLILVDGDPLTDISTLANIRTVVHLGVEVAPSQTE